jgi:hypothetical protein
VRVFYSEPIEALFDRPPVLEKRPGCPDGFVWRGDRHRIVAVLREWHAYAPRGASRDRALREHGRYWVAAAEQRRGSWGVGRDYYRVTTDRRETFDIYYDRRPQGPAVKGGWFLWRSVENPDEPPPGPDERG